jgi:hypothetical protein
MFRCTSSRSSFHSKLPDSISAVIWPCRAGCRPGLGADDALRGQHLGVGQRALDVGLPQALVEEHAGGVALDQVAHRLGKQGRPGLGFLVELVLGHGCPAALQYAGGRACWGAGGPVRLRHAGPGRFVAEPARGWPALPAGAAAGRLLLVAALVLRARGRTPAATAARLTELQSRIRPHFLFNTLNSAIALVRAEPAKAEALLEDLSDLFRHALVEQGESVTLADEIALARRYLAIEQVRFGDRCSGVGAGPARRRCAPAAAAAAAAGGKRVKHGVEPSATGATVRISTQRRGSVVLIKVTNTVPAGAGSARRPRRGAGQRARPPAPAA